MPGVSSLETSVSLIVATLDLTLVKLLRSAIRTADISGAKDKGSSLLAPAAVYEPRRVLHPEPRYEQRHALPLPHCSTVRTVEHIAKPLPPLEPPYITICLPETSAITPSPIRPPWMTMPWENREPLAKVIKVFVYPPDITHKGSLIDCFI
jgi:hypothetical protein